MIGSRIGQRIRLTAVDYVAQTRCGLVTGIRFCVSKGRWLGSHSKPLGGCSGQGILDDWFRAVVRISSQSTFFYKRIFPIAWFGFVGLFVCLGAWQGIAKGPFEDVFPFFAVPLLLAVFGYVLMKWLVFDLVDEVWDAGTELVVKNRGREARIALSQIVNLNYQGFVNPPGATVMALLCGLSI